MEVGFLRLFISKTIDIPKAIDLSKGVDISIRLLIYLRLLIYIDNNEVGFPSCNF